VIVHCGNIAVRRHIAGLFDMTQSDELNKWRRENTGKWCRFDRVNLKNQSRHLQEKHLLCSKHGPTEMSDRQTNEVMPRQVVSWLLGDVGL